MLSKLNRSGLGYFQVPTYIRGYSFNSTEYLTRAGVSPEPEMHAFPQDRLWALIADSGCEILETREDDAAGAHAVSNRVLVRKL